MDEMGQGRDREGGNAETPRRTARDYCAALKHAERVFQDWHDVCDKIDELWSSLERLRGNKQDRELQLFWANMEVMAPAVYARPPQPVVAPRYPNNRKLPSFMEQEAKRREDVAVAASETLERCVETTLEQADIDSTMRAVRDGLLGDSRGQVWLRYEAEGQTEEDFTEAAEIEHLDRCSFLHEPARTWKDVGWTARDAWFTRSEFRKRFPDVPFDHVEFEKREDDLGDEQQCRVWEVWDKTEQRVVWVTHEYEEFLDESPPLLKLEGFFPCPRPAYGGLQSRTLIPIPDYLRIRDQLDEVNDLTARIHGLTNSLIVAGVYSAGAPGIGTAIEEALQKTRNNLRLVPIDGVGLEMDKAISWLPLEQVASTISTCVELRRQVIDDVYQLTGISDIIRGSTDPNETLGAQQLKSQWGSIRIRNRQEELQRFARDIVRIVAEIIAEEFSPDSIALLAQTDLPYREDLQAHRMELEQQGAQIQAQVQAAMQSPEIVQGAQANPEMAQQAQQQVQAQLSQIQGQIAELDQIVTIEDVTELLDSQRLRPFTLDIETDSTVQPDEEAAKAQANEFMQSMMTFLERAVPALTQFPQLAEITAQTVRHIASIHRVGRDFEGAVDRLAEQLLEMSESAQGAQQGDPEAQAQLEQQAAKAEAEIEKINQQMQIDQQKAQLETQRMQLDGEIKQQEALQEREEHTLKMKELTAQIERIAAQTEAAKKAAEAKPETKEAA